MGRGHRCDLYRIFVAVPVKLDIAPDELSPRPSRLSELEALVAELRHINNTVNSLIPRIRTAIGSVIDADAPVKMRDIVSITASYFGMTEMQLLSDRRNRKIVRARQTAMFLCHLLTPRSCPDIAMFFRDRDPTTVLHGVRLIERLLADDKQFAQQIDDISNRIKLGVKQ